MIVFPLPTTLTKRAPEFVLQWTKPGRLTVGRATDASGETVSVGKRRMRLRDGLLTDPPTPNPPALTRLLYEIEWPKGDAWTELWRSGDESIAVRKRPRLEAAQLDPATGSVVRALMLPDFGRSAIAWYPAVGRLLVGSIIEHTGRESHLDALFTLPLARSPLPFFRFWDVSSPNGALGVPVPRGRTLDDVIMIPFSPDSPLACGDPVTGRVRWTAIGHASGHWIGGGYVLASRPWALLNGANGREILSNADEALRDADPDRDFVRVVGAYAIAWLTTDAGTVTACFRLEARPLPG